MIRTKVIFFILLTCTSAYLFFQCNSSRIEHSYMINDSIDKGLQFLYNSQNNDGSFAIKGNVSETIDWTDYQVFLTPLFLNMLQYVEEERTSKLVLEKSLNLLLQMEEGEGGWRYYIEPHNPLMKLIPPDADDTACALCALIQYKKVYSKKSIDRLFKYRTKDGFFMTWLVDNPSLEQGVCIVVNANILTLLCLLPEYEQEAIQIAFRFDKMFDGEILDQNIMEKTLYYTTPYAFTYSLSKAYSIKPYIFSHFFIEKIKRFVLNKISNQSSGEPFETALATISLLNLGHQGDEITDSVNFLLQLQNENGSWPQQPFITSYVSVYNEELRKIVGQTAYFYSSSEELSTIICLEAIMKYRATIL